MDQIYANHGRGYAHAFQPAQFGEIFEIGLLKRRLFVTIGVLFERGMRYSSIYQGAHSLRRESHGTQHSDANYTVNRPQQA